MAPPLSPRAQEILDAIEHDVVAQREAPPSPPQPVSVPTVVAVPPVEAPGAREDTDPARLLELVDDLTTKAKQARTRLGTLVDALKDIEREDEAAMSAPIAVRPTLQPLASEEEPAPAEPAASAIDASPAPSATPERSKVGVVDLHHHLLPGIDDGPPTVQDAVELARAAVAAGTTTVVATPHVSWDYSENTAASIAGDVETLRAALAAEGIPLTVLPGAEIAVTRAVDLPDDELRALRLGGGAYLLIECPFTPSAAGFELLLESLLARGHLILLAHPERCPAFHDDRALLERLRAQGILAQVTAGSLTGAFGRVVRDVAHELLRDGLVQVVASDAHSVDRRPPGVLDALAQEGYEEYGSFLTQQMPQAILTGGPLPSPPAMPTRPRSSIKRLLGR